MRILSVHVPGSKLTGAQRMGFVLSVPTAASLSTPAYCQAKQLTDDLQLLPHGLSC